MALRSSHQGDVDNLIAQAFQVKEQDKFKEVSKTVESYFSQQVKNKLVALGYDNDELDELTQEILFEGVEIYENSDDQSDDIRELNGLEEIFSQLLDRAVLLIHAPITPEGTSESQDQDDAIIGELYPSVLSKADTNHAESVQVPSYSLMKKEIKSFMKKKSRKMVLIFNGVTTNKGGLLCFRDNPQPISTDIVLADIQQLLDEASTTEGIGKLQLPQATDFVLASHIQGKNSFQVTSLDSKGKPEALYSIGSLEVIPAISSIAREMEMEQVNEEFKFGMQIVNGDDEPNPKGTVSDTLITETETMEIEPYE